MGLRHLLDATTITSTSKASGIQTAKRNRLTSPLDTLGARKSTSSKLIPRKGAPSTSTLPIMSRINIVFKPHSLPRPQTKHLDDNSTKNHHLQDVQFKTNTTSLTSLSAAKIRRQNLDTKAKDMELSKHAAFADLIQDQHDENKRDVINSDNCQFFSNSPDDNPKIWNLLHLWSPENTKKTTPT
ncbi:hypothetical protein BCR42DRAFT_447962 [Absidia repens]|uniref:Uncharacterized protein n=1 Tax=Absidia repens TaxID=90262 RepID=A0A1X2IRB5_9FUNG|nr:hypothetical protein BCR42DRAFT_447962 [Absidia repens]